MNDFIPVTVGRGQKIHAGRLAQTIKKGRFETHVYQHLCGSGKSSFAHNFRTTSVKKARHGSEIDCEKCVAIIEKKANTG